MALRLVTLEVDGERHVGAVADYRVYDLQVHYPSYAEATGRDASAAPCCMRCLLADGRVGVEAMRECVAWLVEQAADGPPPEQVRLLAPVPDPPKVFALAGNYLEHIKESTRKKPIAGMQESMNRTPRVFMKPPSTTVVGPCEPLRIPRVGKFIDYEVELAVVIGAECKYVTAGNAYDVVAGYTVFNDISERSLTIWQRDETTEWDRFFDWLNGKWMDSFAPTGPWLVPHADIGDPHDLGIRLRLNGAVMQEANTGDMIHSIPQLVEYISSIVTLQPGDIIATGTPAGVGFARQPPVQLKPGDVVEAEVDGIGTLRSEVVAE